MRIRRAHERHMHHARQRHVAHILGAALREPRQIGPRYRAPDIRVGAVERGMQIGYLALVGHALDGLDTCAVALHREHEAAAHDGAIDSYRAGAADAVLAADMAAGEAQVLAQEIDERLASIEALAHLLPV